MRKALERKAIAAHRAGTDWDAFWRLHTHAIRQAEPYNARRYRRLAKRLLHLVLCGNGSRKKPAGDDPAPWETDDLAEKMLARKKQ